jgi:hypothetical protein
MHRATLSPVGTGGAAKELGHHQPGINPLGDAVAMAAIHFACERFR